MKIDILGANGQLGNEMRLCAAKCSTNEYCFSDIEEVDITSPESLRHHLETVRPQVVVNCAAYTNVNKAEEEENLADRINHQAVELLARFSREFHYLLIHVSTDYVFDGCSCVPYTEADACCPVSAYGRTKRAGEEAILAFAEKAIIIRTAWLYSSFGNNFVKTMLKLGQEKEEVKVVFDQIGTPTYAADLAEIIMKFISLHEDVKGTEIYHFTNEGVCSWYDFARRIIASVSDTCRVLPIESSEYPTPTRRPPYSVLNKKKLKNRLQTDIPHWEDALERCLAKLLQK